MGPWTIEIDFGPGELTQDPHEAVAGLEEGVRQVVLTDSAGRWIELAASGSAARVLTGESPDGEIELLLPRTPLALAKNLEVPLQNGDVDYVEPESCMGLEEALAALLGFIAGTIENQTRPY